MRPELRGLPKKAIKRIMSKECVGQVSDDSVDYIKSVLEGQIKEICRKVVISQEARNKFRKFHGVRELKRFDVTLYKNVVEGALYSPSGLKIEGEEANSVYTPSSSEEARIEVT